MKFAKLKPLFLSLLVGGSLLAASLVAIAEEPLTVVQPRDELSEIKTRLVILEQQQKEILDKEDQILKELDIVKIWVHRK